ncbi:hypothetical protein ACFQ1R_12295 [Mariniflexile jejuense]|uniref:DUF4825 domain-containing protein n=1 Tax=Mariniflexile jejuense TaxID=1173582 RepID=A0ABW3JL63_9FLAO
MKKEIIFILSTIVFLNCESEKKFSDYNELDFYEVQGIINYVGSNKNPFDSQRIKDVSFSYFLDRPVPIKGIEKNINLFELDARFPMYESSNGYPLIVLVHKKDENISFYGQIGILENLNDKEKEFLSQHFKNEMQKIKKKMPEYIYNALTKDTVRETSNSKQ